MVVDGHISPAAPWLGPEQVNSGGIFYFGGKQGNRMLWSFLLLCLGDDIARALSSANPRD